MREGWKQFPLGEIVELGKGGSWGQDDPSAGLIQAVCLRGTDLADLIDGKIPDAPVRWIKESELRKSECSKDMVLIETSGSKCGRSIVLTEEILAKFDLPVIYSNFCRTLTIETKTVTREFIEIWFSHNYANGLIPSYRATSAMPNLDVKALLRVEHIQVPPLPEQNRIVDLISSVDSYIEALQQQLESAKRSRNAVLHELMNQALDEERKPLIELAKLQRGHDLPTQDRIEGSIPVVASNGVVGFHNTHKAIRPGVVTGRSGTIGKVIYIDDDYWPLNTTLYVIDFKGNLPKFVALVLETLKLENYAGGSTVPSLDRNVLSQVPVPCPSIKEQERIVEIISAMDTVVNQTQLAVTEGQNLRSGLLSDLLSGNHEIPSSYDKFIGAA